MKRAISLLLVLMMLFSCAGCGGPSPEQVAAQTAAEEFMTALKSGDANAIKDKIAPQQGGEVEIDFSSLSELSEDDVKASEPIFKTLFGDMEFQTKNCTVLKSDTGTYNAAIVDVNIKNYDFGTDAEQFIKELLVTVFAAALGGAESAETMMETVLTSYGAKAKARPIEKSVAIEMMLDDGVWKVASAETFIDIATGELFTALQNLDENELFGGLFPENNENNSVIWGDGDATINTDANIEETILVDEKDIRVTAKEINYYGAWGPIVEVLIENNSKQDLVFSANYVTVNGFMIDGNHMTQTVAAGKKAQSTIELDEEHLLMSGIRAIDEIELELYVYDDGTWNDYLLKHVALETKRSTAEIEPGVVGFAGQTVYDANGVKISFLDIIEDGFWGPEVVVCIENNTDKNITIDTEKESVNGFMTSCSLSHVDVVAGARVIGMLELDGEDLETNKITELKDIEFVLIVSDMDTWDKIFETETITASLAALISDNAD